MSGENPRLTPVEFSALLDWLAGRRNDGAGAIDREFQRCGVAEAPARQHVRRYLDAAFFNQARNPRWLFAVDGACDGAAIRARYKQLLQVFHPDRHTQDRAWFAAKAGQLNAAYAGLEMRHGTREPQSGRRGVAGAKARFAGSIHRRSFPTPGRHAAVRRGRAVLRRKLVTRLGEPARLEKRIYMILILFLSSLIVVFYIAQLSAGAPQERDSPVQEPDDWMS